VKVSVNGYIPASSTVPASHFSPDRLRGLPRLTARLRRGLLRRQNRRGGPMPSQLRIYTINRGRLDDFVAAWRAGVSPLRQQFGFRVAGAWGIRERNQFVWILSYDGPQAWEAADAAYYGSPQRAALNPDPAQWIAQGEHWVLR